MPEKPRLALRSVSVVVTAEFHNPSILNPDFLVSRGIVPPDWVAAEVLTTPALSVVRYDNGVAWTVNPSQLTITQPAGPAFEENCEIHQLTQSYLAKLPHVPYRALGLNCEVVVSEPAPPRRLVERFGASRLGTESVVLGMTPRFALDAGGPVCYIGIEEMLDSPSERLAKCNMHHQGPLDVDGLCKAIERWPERQDFVVETLTTLWGY